MTRKFPLTAFVAALLLGGCTTVERLWAGGPKELSRIPPGAFEYRCDANRTLVLRFDPSDRSAWVLFPDREVRLDGVAGASGARYSNGRNTLSANGNEAFLEEGTAVTHANCKRAAG